MSGLFWLASYPKSGNTWFRAFLANLQRGGDAPVDLDALGDGRLASARGLFDDLAGVESSDLASDEIESLRPRIYEHLAATATGIAFHKIHDAYVPTPAGRPLVPPAAARGVVYLLRNPLDVAVSYAHHDGRPIDEIVSRMADEDYCLCASPHRIGTQLRQRLSSWSRHVTSWADAPGLRVRVVRYEDLSLDPQRTFLGAARWAGLETDPQAVARAIDRCRFEVLRKKEQEAGFAESSPRAGAFFRAGRVGSWRETLDDRQRGRIISDHAEVMRRFGYLDHDDLPVF